MDDNMAMKYPKQISLYVSQATYDWLQSKNAKTISASARDALEHAHWKEIQDNCDHNSTHSFGCMSGVTRCDKCGKTFGIEKAFAKYMKENDK